MSGGREGADVIVIGAGAAGVATARELARRGHRPIVVERHELGHTLGSSHGTSRIVRVAHDREEDVRDALEAMELWRVLERDLGVQMLVNVGGLDFGSHVGRTRAALQAAGVAFEMLEPREVARRFPAVAPHAEPALFQPDGAVALADVVLDALARDAVRRGADVRPGTTVERVEPNRDGVTVHTSGGAVHARAVVLAAGGWIGPLAAAFGLEVDVDPRLQTPVHLALRNAPFGTVPTIIEFDDAGQQYYALPQPGGAEIKGGFHVPGRPFAPEDSDRAPDPAQIEAFETWARERYTGLGERVDAYGCIYTWRPDERFLLERTGRVVTVSCCSGRGFKFVPQIGLRAAALAEEAAAA